MASRLCSHKGIDNKGKIDKGKKDNIKLIIASENTTKSFETAKKPLNLIALSVQLLIIVPTRRSFWLRCSISACQVFFALGSLTVVPATKKQRHRD